MAQQGTPHESAHKAPGGPGKPVFGTTARKQGIGTAATPASRVWFTIVHGALGDVSFPSPDRACVRMVKLIVTDGDEFLSDETENATSEVRALSPEIPLHQIRITFPHGRFLLEKEVLCDPVLDAVFMRVRFVPLQGAENLRVFAYVAAYPFLAGANADVVDTKGRQVLTASSDGAGIALAASAPFLKASVGFVTTSDGLVDLTAKKQLVHQYNEARGGHVGLTCEIDRAACGDEWTFALAFGGDSMEAAQYALAAIDRGFEYARKVYTEQWLAWHAGLKEITGQRNRALVRTSATVLKVLRDKRFPGGAMAALATPWGSGKEENAEGTYHLVWTRDLVECATALLALGCTTEVLDTLSFLRATQEADGHWPQNMTLAGAARWDTTQLDELALPVLLTSLAEREGVLDASGLEATWPMVRKAAGYLARAGGSTLSDRWEDEHGYTPFTLATAIAAMLVAARYAESYAEPDLAAYLRETADAWHDSIDRWLLRTDDAVCKQYGIRGYYLRSWDREGTKMTQYRHENDDPPDISPEAIAFTRFGLRSAEDSMIADTLSVVDQLLLVDVDGAHLWRRFTWDAYGESKDGKPFHKNNGEGHGWPLLTGERAHHELLAGRHARAVELARAIEAVASREHLLGEQIWEGPDIPEYGLVHGAPNNSAAPLGWAHAEYVLLCRSLLDGKAFDRPRETVERYLEQKTQSAFSVWRESDPRSSMEQGLTLRAEFLESGTLDVTISEQTFAVQTRDTGVGVHVADIAATKEVAPGTSVSFRFHPSQGLSLFPKRFVVEVAAAMNESTVS